MVVCVYMFLVELSNTPYYVRLPAARAASWFLLNGTVVQCMFIRRVLVLIILLDGVLTFDGIV